MLLRIQHETKLSYTMPVSETVFEVRHLEALQPFLRAAAPDEAGERPVHAVSDVPGGGEVRVFPASMTDIHQGSQVTISNQPIQDTVTVVSVQPPNQIVATGFHHHYDAGATLTFSSEPGI